jgi:hypothetical protein
MNGLTADHEYLVLAQDGGSRTHRIVRHGLPYLSA